VNVGNDNNKYRIKKELKEYLENMKENNKKKYAKTTIKLFFLYFW